MDYFDTFSSNTLAGSGNQFFFCRDDETELVKSCILYKAFVEGCYSY